MGREKREEDERVGEDTARKHLQAQMSSMEESAVLLKRVLFAR